jgi:hypothetical protein
MNEVYLNTQCETNKLSETNWEYLKHKINEHETNSKNKNIKTSVKKKLI